MPIPANLNYDGVCEGCLERQFRRVLRQKADDPNFVSPVRINYCPAWEVVPPLEAWALKRSRALELEQGAEQAGESKVVSEQGEGAALAPSRQKAYSQYQWAVRTNAKLQGATDQQVYDWLAAHIEDGEQLPSFSTWGRYLRDARATHGTSKHNRRAGRETDRNIARPDQI
jgi:hypothetical protein